MPSLPNDPSLEHFRRQARTLQRAVRAGDRPARDLLARHHPAPPADLSGLPLSAAQLAVARGYGFASWPALRRYLDEAADLTRNPAVDPTVGRDPTGSTGEQPADQFCRLACLVYSDVDGPDRWAAARALLAQHPELPTSSIAAAAAAADADAIKTLLAADPAAANRLTGPHRWAPLMYLAYSRVRSGDDPAGRSQAAARTLLEAGADVNAGYLWRGLPTPFTVLTGVFGEGEQGPGKQPRHPDSADLARLLLSAGADANDGQALYNRMFRPGNSHLKVLFEFGLGRGDGGPWRRRLGDAMESPAAMMGRQIGWAIDHGFTERLELFIEHGVDLSGMLPDGRTPMAHAITAGRLPIIDLLRSAGIAAPPLTTDQQLIGALLAGDRAAVRQLSGSAADRVAAVRRAHPGLIRQADKPAAIALIAELGFDINAHSGGVTALHDAAFNGDTELIRALLAAGADPARQDVEHRATPLGWAEYAGQPAAVEMLSAGGPIDRGAD